MRRSTARASRWLGWSLVLAALVLALPAPAPPAATAAPQAAQGLTPVRVGMQYIVSDAGVFLADERGYLREVGLELQPQRLDNVDLQTAMASGQVDAGGIGPTAAVLNAFLRGVRLRIVADRGTLIPGYGYLALVVRKDLVDSGAVREMRDLRGRKIAAQPPLFATPGWYLFSRLLANAGLTEDDIEYVPLGFADQTAALASGTIDAAWGAEPGPTASVESGLAVWFRGADEALSPFSLGGLAYSEPFAQQTDLARRFMVAYLRGVRTYLDAFTRNQGRAEVVEVLTRYTALKDPALYDRMRMPYMDPNGTFSLNGYDEVQRYFVSHGVLPQAIDIAQIVDNSFVEYAAQQLGPY